MLVYLQVTPLPISGVMTVCSLSFLKRLIMDDEGYMRVVYGDPHITFTLASCSVPVHCQSAAQFVY
jgi:hypothetical protein